MVHVYEWDKSKAFSNKRKHGIDFEYALRVFLDENRIEIYDTVHSTKDEDRYITIGCVGDILLVVYTIRGSKIRLISARLATSKERRLYYGSFF